MTRAKLEQLEKELLELDPVDLQGLFDRVLIQFNSKSKKPKNTWANIKKRMDEFDFKNPRKAVDPFPNMLYKDIKKALLKDKNPLDNIISIVESV
jgi:hypothetical protein